MDGLGEERVSPELAEDYTMDTYGDSDRPACQERATSWGSVATGSSV